MRHYAVSLLFSILLGVPMHCYAQHALGSRDDGLAGRVKRVKEVHIPDGALEAEAGSRAPTTEIAYDSDRRRTEFTYYMPDGGRESDLTDQGGRPTEHDSYSREGCLSSRLVYRLDDKGRVSDDAQLAGLSFGTSPPSGVYFEAEMEMRTILYLPGSSADERDFIFKVYQNLDNVVRSELESGPPLSAVGEGRDVHIMDHGNDTLIAYDKGKTTAFRMKLRETETLRPSPSAISLGEMTILGYRCTGSQDTIKYPGGTIVVTQETWFASESPFKTPLLVISRTLSPDGQLTALSIRTVKSIRTTSWLDPSLFQVPSSYKIVDH